MKLTVICEGAGWGGGTSGAMELDQRPFILHYKRGDTLHLDFLAGSGDEIRIQKRIGEGTFTVLSAPRKPAA